MKKKVLTYFAVFGLVLTMFFPVLHAVAVEPYFVVKAVAGEAGMDGMVSVEVMAEPKNGGTEEMASFQFTVNYPKENLRLVTIEPAVVGGFAFNESTGKATYSVMSGNGVELKQGGTKLATVTFRVLDGREGDYSVDLTEVEITRPEDQFGKAVEVHAAQIHYIPVLKLESASSADGTVVVTLNDNPAGTLCVAVYSENGQMLRHAAQNDLTAAAGSVEVRIDLRGGSYVKAFFVDNGFAPICPSGAMKLA